MRSGLDQKRSQTLDAERLQSVWIPPLGRIQPASDFERFMPLEGFLKWKYQPGNQVGIEIHGMGKAPLKSNGSTPASAAPGRRRHHADTRPDRKLFFMAPDDETPRTMREHAKRANLLNTTNRHPPRQGHHPGCADNLSIGVRSDRLTCELADTNSFADASRSYQAFPNTTSTMML